MILRPESPDELFKDYQSPQGLFGEEVILKQPTKGMIKHCLQAEIEAHLGYLKHGRRKPESTNTRNGASTKTRKGEYGELQMSVPRDGDGSFGPLLVKKRQSRLEGFEEKILALYAWHDDSRYSSQAPGVVWGRGLANLFSNMTEEIMLEVHHGRIDC